MLSTVLILFTAAIALILAEFFIPGGILGVMGALCLLASMGLGAYYFPDYAIFIILGEICTAAASIFLGMYLISNTSAGQFLVLKGSQLTDKGYTSPGEDSELEGQTGEAFTMLRPAGTVLIDDRRVNAVSSGELIPKGAKVRVIEVEGYRVVVEEVPAGEAESA